MAKRNPMRAYKRPHLPDFKRVSRELTDAAREETVSVATDFAEAEKESFRSEIRYQKFLSFEAFPLSPSYLARKKRLKLDTRVMIATGHYLRQIRVESRKDAPGKTMIHVGFDDNAFAQNLDGTRSDILLRDVAMIQEKGSRKMNIPARRHWGDHLTGMYMRARSVRTRARARVLARMKSRFPSMG